LIGEDAELSQLTLFPVDKDVVQHTRRLTLAVMWNYAKWYSSHVFSMHGHQIFAMMLLVVAFTRNDLISWVYLIMLALSMAISKSRCVSPSSFPYWTSSETLEPRFEMGLPIFVSVQTCILFGEYASVLSFPPFMQISWPPNLGQDVLEWLGFARPFPGASLFPSILALNVSAYVFNPHRFLFHPPDGVWRAELMLLDFLLLWLVVLLLFVPKGIPPFPEAQPPLRYDFTLKPRSWNDELKFQVCSDKKDTFSFFSHH